jgi:hypothetical protein
MHQHQFEVHFGLRTSFGALAWVPAHAVTFAPVPGELPSPPTMQKCITCGEQGYAIP